MDPVHKKTLALMQEWLDNTPDDEFLALHNSLERNNGPLVTDFIVVDYPPMDAGTRDNVPDPRMDELIMDMRSFVAKHEAIIDHMITITIPDSTADNRPQCIRYLKKRKDK